MARWFRGGSGARAPSPDSSRPGTPPGFRVQGSIAQTGNTRVWRLLVEAAWHHRQLVLIRTIRPRASLPTPASAEADLGSVLLAFERGSISTASVSIRHRDGRGPSKHLLAVVLARSD